MSRSVIRRTPITFFEGVLGKRRRCRRADSLPQATLQQASAGGPFECSTTLTALAIPLLLCATESFNNPAQAAPIQPQAVAAPPATHLQPPAHRRSRHLLSAAEGQERCFGIARGLQTTGYRNGSDWRVNLWGTP